jgi:hypothetical protein
MSPITSAQIGRYYRTYTDVVRVQEHESPLERAGHSLGYFCAGAPLFNEHFLSAVNLAIGPDTVMPKIPRNAAPPNIPQVTVEDPVLVNTWNMVEATIREHCFDGYRPADGDIALAVRQTECLRYHNAIFILVLDWISQAADGDDRRDALTIIGDCHVQTLSIEDFAARERKAIRDKNSLKGKRVKHEVELTSLETVQNTRQSMLAWAVRTKSTLKDKGSESLPATCIKTDELRPDSGPSLRSTAMR